jgi:hypothetical protein
MSWKSELYIVKLKALSGKEYSKKMSFDEIKEYLEISTYGKTYEDYIKPGLLYFTEDLKALAEKLGVDRIVPMGLFIRGIYGGENKKGEEKYAGLVVVEHSVEGAMFKFKLYNTKDELIVPVDYLKKYGVKVFKMIYIGEINPFRINKYIDIILSEQGGGSLRKFLEEALKLNERYVSAETRNKTKKLIYELRQPNNIAVLDVNSYYVIYRAGRAFTACALNPKDNDAIAESNASYIETRKENVAYYYAGVLNYLAFKVIALKRSFNRSQYARPLQAIYIAGLSWNNMDEETKTKVVELSKRLHEKSLSKEYSNQKKAIEDLEGILEFKELVKILDSKVNPISLENSLEMVSFS